MNAQQISILDSLMPEIMNMVANGMDVMEATKKALIAQTDFCGEMAMNQTRRAKHVNQQMFEVYCERTGLA